MRARVCLCVRACVRAYTHACLYQENVLPSETQLRNDRYALIIKTYDSLVLGSISTSRRTHTDILCINIISEQNFFVVK